MTDRVRLLVVDDDLAGRQTIRRVIERTGLDAVLDEADSAQAARRLLATAAYDCLLVDHALLDLAAELREHQNMTPIIFYTERQDEEVVEEGADAGVTDFVVK